MIFPDFDTILNIIKASGKEPKASITIMQTAYQEIAAGFDPAKEYSLEEITFAFHTKLGLISEQLDHANFSYGMAMRHRDYESGDSVQDIIDRYNQQYSNVYMMLKAVETL